MAAFAIRRNSVNLFRKTALINKQSPLKPSKSILEGKLSYFNQYRLLTAWSPKLLPLNLNLTQKRWKYSKKQKSKAIRDEGNDSEDEDGTNVEAEFIAASSKNAKIIETTLGSMRIDAIVKAGLGTSRNKVETTLYESKLRHNGGKVIKKGRMMAIDDTIDVIQGPSPHNPKFIVINRVTILDAKLEDNNYRVKMLREKNLVVEDYKEPWQKTSEDE